MTNEPSIKEGAANPSVFKQARKCITQDVTPHLDPVQCMTQKTRNNRIAHLPHSSTIPTSESSKRRQV